ncbi:hypothetical protein CK203_067633 [Vitis vinifera]|uniref:K-box domain-containing protein n=1 Tax=Vitis vinifera TaxID=29760 RepID=A0A438EBS3_VITVI|nr:hypothetical protein CK203_067633 [Vitis vinifera]
MLTTKFDIEKFNGSHLDSTRGKKALLSNNELPITMKISRRRLTIRLRNIIESYLQISRDAEANVGSSSHEAKQKRYPVPWAGADLLKIVESQVEGPRIEQLRLSELSQLEQKLDGMLRQTRRRKTQLMMEAIACLKEKVKELNEQKQQMEKMIAAAESKDALQHEDLVMEQAGNNSKPPPQNVVLQLL